MKYLKILGGSKKGGFWPKNTPFSTFLGTPKGLKQFLRKKHPPKIFLTRLLKIASISCGQVMIFTCVLKTFGLVELHLGKVSFEKKKCELSHFWSGPPHPPLKSVKCKKFIFFHTLFETHFGQKNFFFTYKSIKLRKISGILPNMSKIFGLPGRGYPPPIQKKIFFADFHDLGHERKKNKKSVKMTQFCPDPPPLSVKFHTFFFSNETFP